MQTLHWPYQHPRAPLILAWMGTWPRKLSRNSAKEALPQVTAMKLGIPVHTQPDDESTRIAALHLILFLRKHIKTKRQAFASPSFLKLAHLPHYVLLLSYDFPGPSSDSFSGYGAYAPCALRGFGLPGSMVLRISQDFAGFLSGLGTKTGCQSVQVESCNL